jgi:2-dehydro-3-deoxygalactonokinase
VHDGRIQRFTTLMTGEVFAALSQHTILARTVDPHAALDAEAFLQGVDLAHTGQGLLHHAFGARTLALFQRMSAGALASYLSGLCIGEELRTMLTPSQKLVMLIGSPALTQRYALALRHRGVQSHVFGAESTWAGLHALSKMLPAPHP